MIQAEQRNINTTDLDKMIVLKIAQVTTQETAVSVAALEPVLPQVARAVTLLKQGNWVIGDALRIWKAQ